MTTQDFTTFGNYGNNPLRAEQLRLASQINLDEITVDLWHGPIGSCGFRKGTWTATYLGQDYRFYDSIPHASELDAQRDMLKRSAALHIAGVQSGYVCAAA